MYNKGMFQNYLNKYSNLLVLDIGTASISAALIKKHISPEHEKTEKTEILKVLRYPLNLFGYTLGSDSAGRLPFIFKDTFLKAFKEAGGITRKIDYVLVGLAEPFFLKESITKSFDRPKPEEGFERDELKRLLKNLEEDAISQLDGAHKNLVVVDSRLTASLVNGYEVADPIGYKGKSIELGAEFTLINAALKDYIYTAREQYAPMSKMLYFADSDVIRKALKATENVSDGALVFDIGGEVTSAFFITDSDKNTGWHGTYAFGIKTVERRLGAHLKTDVAEVESMLKRYSAGTLEESLRSNIDKALQPALLDWWIEFQKLLKRLDKEKFFASSSGHVAKKIIVTGGGSDVGIFSKFIADSFKSGYDIEISLENLRSEAFKDFFATPFIFSGGSDIILTSLPIFGL